MPAYTRLVPLLRASSTSACPMPRLNPVIRTVLSAIVTTPSCIGGARRALSPPCGGGDPAKGRNPSPATKAALGAGFTPGQAWLAAVWAAPTAGDTLAAGISLTDSAPAPMDPVHSADHNQDDHAHVQSRARRPPGAPHR
jgi:hypothetical protein